MSAPPPLWFRHRLALLWAISIPHAHFAPGTPSGVGYPQGLWLQSGDEVEVTVEEIGVLRTTIAGPQAAAGL